ncbi:MAG: PqqD family protein [Chlorobi bacterium]|nr:PqqD family protein [Chlorobiota bacterium]
MKDLAISKNGFVFNPSTGESFRTNEVGRLILEMLQEGKSDEEILERILEEYDVSKEEAERDLLEFLNMLKFYNLM